MPEEYGVNESRGGVVSVASTNASQLNAAIAPQEPDEQAEEGVQFQEPCTLRGLGAGLGSGLLGGLFGFLPAAVKNRGKNWHLVWRETTKSAYSFALMGGVYTAVQCLCQRVRQVDDSWNRAVAGCASGVAISWQNGPLAAAQSCACIAVFSSVLGGTQPAEAATLPAPAEAGTSSTRSTQRQSSSLVVGSGPHTAGLHSTQHQHQQLPWQPAVRELQRHLHAMPRLAFLAPCCNVRSGGRTNGCSVAIGSKRS